MNLLILDNWKNQDNVKKKIAPDPTIQIYKINSGLSLIFSINVYIDEVGIILHLQF